MNGLRADVVVVGAGFSGLYALHKMRELGFAVVAVEKADSVGGTWYYNRYPGCRCDIESIEYSYSFSEEIQQEWVWTESMPGQPEIERYLNFVADRLDLRRDIRFNTTVTEMTFVEAQHVWRVQTSAGDELQASFVIAASGILSVPLEPAIPGIDTFEGASLFASRFPHDGFDFTDRRVALIGTGSTGVQMAPIVAENARQLSVFQRSAAFTLPAGIRRLEPGELDSIKVRYGEIRAAQREAFTGASRISAFSVMSEAATQPPIRSATRDEQLAAIDAAGVKGALFWSDVLTDIDANAMATQLYGEAIARIVQDPATAASLVPDYAFGCKRPIVDTGYFEMFNRDNVTLVDLRKGGIVEITADGIATELGDFEVDVIVYATGFDAMTGALTHMDVVGRDGTLLRDIWAAEGPVSNLGLQVAGFPNLFTVIGPGSPSFLANIANALEQHVDWIGDCLVFLRDHSYRSIEADPVTQEQWVEHATSLVAGSVAVHPTCNSWYVGSNVPGRKRMYVAYAGGMPEYRRRCDDVAAAGYAGFILK